MKSLNRRISEILKSVLLFSLFLGGAQAQSLVTSDRFIIRILDSTISLYDFQFQLRNLKGLDCVYDDSYVIAYFHKAFVKDFDKFVGQFPKTDPEVRKYLHQNEVLLQKIRLLFKVLRYTQDQKTQVTEKLIKVVQETVVENKCDARILQKEGLKDNFFNLLQSELYFRARYGSQLKGTKNFESIRPSIDLFIESLDKQFSHEYYW